MKIRALECGSAAGGPLAAGCEHCSVGGKMVLFVTGRCSTGCFYCPVSDERRGTDRIYANEMLISDMDEIIAEAEMTDATGTGITGGDPLMNMERTVSMIRMLKERFGNGHHIHLYTSTIDPTKAMELRNAGLDELRLHPSPDAWAHLSGTAIADVAAIDGLVVGIEVPALPDMENDLIKMAMDASSLGIRFINLNELEFSEGNWDMMSSHDYELKDDISAAIYGSEDTARKTMSASTVPIHFCSSMFKDSVQLRRRLIRRAEHIATERDIVTEDGTILKGILYANNLNEAMEFLSVEYEVPDGLMHIDTERGRLEVASWVLEEISDEIPYRCYIIEEYPTADRLEVERMPL